MAIEYNADSTEPLCLCLISAIMSGRDPLPRQQRERPFMAAIDKQLYTYLNGLHTRTLQSNAELCTRRISYPVQVP